MAAVFELKISYWRLMPLHLIPIALVVLVTIGLAGCGSKDEKAAAPAPRAVPVTTKKMEAADVSNTVTLIGAMDSRSSVDLYPRIDGYIAKLPIMPGQFVKPGELLLVIDSNKEEAAVAAKRSSVELAKSDLAKEVGKLGSLEAELEARKSMVDYNNLEYQRYYWLEKRGVVAKATVDKEDRDLKVAHSRLNSLYAEITAQKEVIARAKNRIEEAKAELSAEQAELSYHTMRAPFGGVLGDVPVKLGDYVNSQTKLTKVSKTKPLEVNVEVPQEQSKLVHVGTRMEILDNGGSRIGETTVFYLSPTVNLQNQSVLVKGEFPNNGNELRPDQSVQVKLILKTEPALSVPTEAISFVAGKAFVFVADRGEDGKPIARQRPIQITSIQDNEAQVSSGLKAGEDIIVSGIQLLADKSPIEVTGGP